jgi:methionine-rich copper-binding protein CopC
MLARRVLISGAGIAGPTLAFWLTRAGFQATLIDHAHALRTEAAKTEASNQAVLVVPITKALAAGTYTVHWQAVSVDTHHTQGTFEYTVKP